ncbi:ankyrin repeats (3 copies) domain-containing protein [Hirsutella rhossiliensis]|uniref:Ankyrin repeats (3 copies) domain-containing protein n=1 Tax=Hirsutella rhossiliensis TaxID=111463 RepID=A0A9P8N836_9HYPO|nr:ankyrin repeats (3 copies) domain-containing protein [Hirsutella rhossiliensis]KAH0967706.1 ankyrin repeats (3 copies) domain-containing protein [Hirsutella rhossiliensis]
MSLIATLHEQVGQSLPPLPPLHNPLSLSSQQGVRWKHSLDVGGEKHVPETLERANQAGTIVKDQNLSLLHGAAKRGDEQVVKTLLDVCHFHPAELDEDNITPLRYAVRCPHFGVVRLLLDHGADPSQRSRPRMTPLHAVIALDQDATEIVALLLAFGADTSAQDHYDRTPLHLALRDSFDTTALEEAIIVTSHAGIAKLLLSRGARLFPERESPRNPIYEVAKYGNVELARLLLEYGCDPNHASDRGDPPLHAACRQGHFDMVQLLLDSGAQINAQSANCENTALHEALRSRHLHLVECLLQAGPDLAIANEHGDQPLHIALSLGRQDVIEALLDAGADIAARDGEGDTFLEILEGWGHDEVATKLAERVPA